MKTIKKYWWVGAIGVAYYLLSKNDYNAIGN